MPTYVIQHMCYSNTCRFNFWGLIIWRPISIRRICVKDDTCCECQKCSDIKTYRQCVRTAPCPDATNRNTFCYWKPCKDNCELAEGKFKVFDSSVSTDEIQNALVAPKVWGECDCCKVTLCEKGQYFDKRLCKCVCRPINCPRPFVQDPDTCQCVCPKDFDCGRLKKLDPCTCKCKCKPFFCFYPRRPNSDTCQCDCPVNVTCRHPLRYDAATCRCR